MKTIAVLAAHAPVHLPIYAYTHARTHARTTLQGSRIVRLGNCRSRVFCAHFCLISPPSHPSFCSRRYLREKADAELQSIDTRITYLQQIGPHNHILRNLKNAEDAEWHADQWAAEQEQKVALQLQQSQWATAEDPAAEAYNDDGYGGGYDDGYGGGYDAGAYVDSGGAEWEQYYDESAQAYYWYNNNTGEASWTDPNA